jgi:hypothetical protein
MNAKLRRVIACSCATDGPPGTQNEADKGCVVRFGECLLHKINAREFGIKIPEVDLIFDDCIKEKWIGGQKG